MTTTHPDIVTTTYHYLPTRYSLERGYARTARREVYIMLTISIVSIAYFIIKLAM